MVVAVSVQKDVHLLLWTLVRAIEEFGRKREDHHPFAVLHRDPDTPPVPDEQA